MRRDAVFSGMVHFPCTDLHLKGNTLLADNRRMERLVHIRLGRGNIVLEAVRERLENIVYNAEHIVAVVHGIDDDAHREDVENLLDGFSLHIGFTVNAVDTLDPSLDIYVRYGALCAGDDFLLDGGNELVALRFAQGERVLDFTVAHRVEITDREVLHLLLHRADAEPVCNRRVVFHRFKRSVPALLLRLAVYGAHIVQAVGHEHLAYVFRLLLFPR